jgi:hypothetical protein
MCGGKKNREVSLSGEISISYYYFRYIDDIQKLQERIGQPTKQKAERRKRPPMPMHEDHGGTPQCRHCPSANHREDRNPNYHEEQSKDVERKNSCRTSPKYIRKGT